MTTAEQATRQVENIIREMLTERFNDTFVFNPIIVIPRVDHDGDYSTRTLSSTETKLNWIPHGP